MVFVVEETNPLPQMNFLITVVIYVGAILLENGFAHLNLHVITHLSKLDVSSVLGDLSYSIFHI